MMMKTIIRALLSGVAFVIVYFAFQIAYGVYLTAAYVPDIISAYESVDHVQHKAAFGTVGSPLGIGFEIAGMMLLGAMVYYAYRLVRSRIKR